MQAQPRSIIIPPCYACIGEYITLERYFSKSQSDRASCTAHPCSKYSTVLLPIIPIPPLFMVISENCPRKGGVTRMSATPFFVPCIVCTETGVETSFDISTWSPYCALLIFYSVPFSNFGKLCVCSSAPQLRPSPAAPLRLRPFKILFIKLHFYYLL